VVIEHGWQLYSADGTLMATFELYDVPQPSSIGPLHAVMRYWYQKDDNVSFWWCLKLDSLTRPSVVS
jgi:hypothetical protein